MIKVSPTLFLTASVLLLSATQVLAQIPGAPKYVTSAVSIAPSSVHAGSKAALKITLAVSSGFHINSNKPNDPDLIPTTVTLTPISGFAFGTTVFPTAKTITAPALSQKPLSIYTGTSSFVVPVAISKSLKPGKYKVVAEVGYQGCNSSACYPPQTVDLTATVVVK